ncbi:MAG: glycosyltransferase family 9 protein [Candidatus Kapabacteria bacterium]|nr:glycosyltransferase family 9 protein [Candidatus Kapabacteria bacterium]
MKFLKQLEINIRNYINAKFNDTSNVEIVTEPVDILEKIHNPKILLLRQDKIGDIIISTPVFKALREQYPNAEIHVLYGESNYNAQHISNEYGIKPLLLKKGFWSTISLLQQLRKEHYDCIVDLIDNTSTTSSLITKYAKSTYAVGFLKDNAAVYTHVVPLPDRSVHHIIDVIAELLTPFGINPHEIHLAPSYPINEADIHRNQQLFSQATKKVTCFINISGSVKERYWGTDHFIELIQKIQTDAPDCDVFVGSSPEYNAQAQQIVQATGVNRIQPNISFHEYATLIHDADIFISPDTSLIHVASAFNTPTVGLFQHYNLDRMPWYPYNTLHCSCTVTADKRFQDISVDEVFDSFMALYEEVHHDEVVELAQEPVGQQEEN